MKPTKDGWSQYVLELVRGVQRELGFAAAAPEHPQTLLADVLDSMGLVELLAVLAEDCGVTPEAVEACVQHRFGTIGELASALHAAGLSPRARQATPVVAACLPSTESAAPGSGALWLAATAVRLPSAIQSAAVLDELLHRPAAWLEDHAGIRERRTWMSEDPVQAAANAGRDALDQAGVLPEEVGALLVTSEAPPLLTGLAPAVHRLLDLRPTTAALEVGGACTGFLGALWMARALLPRCGIVLIVAVEAPSQLLQVQPGPAGEAAALFGDGAAAAVCCQECRGDGAWPVGAVQLGTDGSGGRLVRAEPTPGSRVELRLDGVALAGRAVRVMADSVREITQRHGLAVSGLRAVVAHGGNGRLPALLARRLGLPRKRVWSETAWTGNLGSASLPVSWCTHRLPQPGPVVWTAAGAGLTWGVALLGVKSS
jgi:3-oxoacyl-[acyl-carrier-protein] synthase-3